MEVQKELSNSLHVWKEGFEGVEHEPQVAVFQFHGELALLDDIPGR